MDPANNSGAGGTVPIVPDSATSGTDGFFDASDGQCGDPFLNDINDPSFANAERWKNEAFNINLPEPAPEVPNANALCMKNCAELKKAERERCAKLRTRISKYLDSIGCPSIVKAKVTARKSATCVTKKKAASKNCCAGGMCSR